MTDKIEKLLDSISELIKMDTQNFYYEVKLGKAQTGKEFTDTVKEARLTNDNRAKIKNQIEETLLEILKDKNIKVSNITGTIAESFSFLIDVFVINHLKVWFAEEEVRELNKLDNPDPTRMVTLVNASRAANNNRVNIRRLLSKKLVGILKGTEGVGTAEPKLFKAEGRK